MRGSLGRPWFAHKRYGYGASLPISWQGWACVAVFFAALSGGIAVSSIPTLIPGWLQALALIAIVCAFIAVCAMKTEGGIRWRWGPSDD